MPEREETTYLKEELTLAGGEVTYVIKKAREEAVAVDLLELRLVTARRSQKDTKSDHQRASDYGK